MAILENLMGALANPNPLMQFGIGVLGSNVGNYGRLGPALMGGMNFVQKAQLLKAKQEQDKQEAAMRQQQMEMQQQKLSLEQEQARQQAQLGPQVGGLLSGIQGLPDTPQKQAVVGMLNAGVPLSSLTNVLPGVLGGQKEPMVTATQADWDRAQRDPAFKNYLESKMPPVTETFWNPETERMETRTTSRPQFMAGERGQAMPRTGAKPLPAAAQDRLIGTVDAMANLNAMDDALTEGLQTGPGMGWLQEFAATKLPDALSSPSAKKFFVARQNLVNQAQTLIKGVPSNFDVTNFEKTLAQFGYDEGTNKMLIQWSKEQLGRQAALGLSMYAGTGVKPSPEVIAALREVGVDVPSVPKERDSKGRIKAYQTFDEWKKEKTGEAMPPAIKSQIDQYKDSDWDLAVQQSNGQFKTREDAKAAFIRMLTGQQ